MGLFVFLMPSPPTAALPSKKPKKLGVIFDSCFKFDQQITQVVKTCFFQSRLLWKVKAYFPLNDFERVIHMFITSLYFGVDQSFTPKCSCMPFDRGGDDCSGFLSVSGSSLSACF